MNLKFSVRILCQVSMLIALAFVFERLLPIINTPTLRITLAFIPMMCCGMLFGPVWAGAASGIADILGWPLMGLTPIPLILLSRIISGFLYGVILHRENLKLWPHAILYTGMTQVFCGMGLTTLGLSQLLGTPFIPLLLSRLPANGIIILLHFAVFPVLVKLRYALRKTGLSLV